MPSEERQDPRTDAGREIQGELPPGPEATEIERMRAELEEADRERTQFRSLLQRVHADFANFRRRTEEEQEERRGAANGGLLLRVLPLLDDLERALSAEPEGRTEVEGRWIEGVELIARKFRALLEAEGVSRIEAMGKPFDPWDHEVVSCLETREHDQGQVIAVVRDGYRLNGKALRSAQVVVAKAPDPGGGP